MSSLTNKIKSSIPTFLYSKNNIMKFYWIAVCIFFIGLTIQITGLFIGVDLSECSWVFMGIGVISIISILIILPKVNIPVDSL
jgi:hypothetical protein